MCKRIFKEETTDKGDIPFYKIGNLDQRPTLTLAENYLKNTKANILILKMEIFSCLLLEQSAELLNTTAKIRSYNNDTQQAVRT